MPFSFTRQEVREHLEALGFKDVSEARLDLFFRDLRRLVKHDEAKTETSGKLNVLHQLFTAS